jgi:putative ABC transport system substrate-binding protein
MRRSVLGLILTLALAILVAPLLANAQPRGRVPRIGVLASTSPAERGAFLDGFWPGLHELGWVEGQSIAIEWRWAEGKPERLPELAADLVRLPVDVVVAAGPTAIRAAQHATRTIPIVMTGTADPGWGKDSSPAWRGPGATSRA